MQSLNDRMQTNVLNKYYEWSLYMNLYELDEFKH